MHAIPRQAWPTSKAFRTDRPGGMPTRAQIARARHKPGSADGTVRPTPPRRTGREQDCNPMAQVAGPTVWLGAASLAWERPADRGLVPNRQDGLQTRPNLIVPPMTDTAAAT